jgi:hypothetical protein
MGKTVPKGAVIGEIGTNKPGRKPGRLERQEHGGALLRGGTIGPGRPSSAVRKACTLAFEQRIAVLTAIADGTEDASPSDRIKAIDVLGKYGLGTKQEIAGDPDNPVGLELIVRREAHPSIR